MDLHGLHCLRGQHWWKRRHDAVVRILADLLRKVFGSAAVTLETRLAPEGVEPVVADVELRGPASTVWFDVAVVSPAAPSYVNQGSASIDLVATRKKEHDKWSKYAPALAAMGCQSSALVPFVIEATGRLGPRASAWLSSLGPDQDSHVDFFLRRLDSVLAHHNAELVHSCDLQRVALPVPASHRAD